MYAVGDKVIAKKKHACGGSLWEVLRSGTTIKLKCLTCSHIIYVTYDNALRMIKGKNEKN